MPGCKSVIIDNKGVMVGIICHIEAAMVNGPRFNASQTNEDRRALSNLLLLCGGHHSQVDSNKNKKIWTTGRVRKLKAEHEARFRGLDATLQKAFQSTLIDTTDDLNPTIPDSFDAFEKAIPECQIVEEDELKRDEQFRLYIERLSIVPDAEREFMLAVIKRYGKIKSNSDSPSVNVDDLKNSLKIGDAKIKKMGEALERYDVGGLHEVGFMDGDFWHIVMRNPSEFVTWAEIQRFCDITGNSIDQFVLHLRFGLLGQSN